MDTDVPAPTGREEALAAENQALRRQLAEAERRVAQVPRRADDRQQSADTAFLRSVLASSGDCIKVLDLEGRLLFMTEGGQRVMEVGDFNAIRGCPWSDFWRGPGNADALAALAAARAGGTGHFQGPADTVAGTPRWWDVQVTPILGANGRPEKLLSVSRDITATRQAEQALRDSEAYWRDLFEKLHEGLIIGELVRNASGRVTDWRYLDVNPAWGRQVGILAGAAPGQTIRELFPGIEDAWVDEMAAVVETGEPDIFTRQVGTIGRWYEGHAFALGGDRFAVLFLEVTERKQAEAALRESQGRLGAALDVAELCTFEWDVRTDAVTLDARSRAIFGFAPGEGTRAQEVFGRIDLADFGRVLAEAQASMRDMSRLETEYRIHQPGGTVRTVMSISDAVPDAEDKPDRMLGVFSDVTERKRIEADLRVLNETLEQQVEKRTRERDRAWRLSQNLLAVADTDGTLLAVNAAWTALLGWGERELVGRRFVALTHPDDLEATRAAFAGIFEAPLTRPYEYRLRHKDGTYRWFAWTGAFEDGTVYANGRHTTAEREQALALAATEEQLRQSQKMEAVGQLTGGLAHDFNNLLAGISGSLELLQARVAQGRIGDLDRYLVAAQGASKRAAALTHRLLAFTRRQTLDPKPTDVNRLVAGMEEMIRRTVGPAVAVEIVGAGGLWTTLVDPNQLENALLNLCINARDAMAQPSPGGSTSEAGARRGGERLTIETGNKWLDARAARERDLPPGQYVTLCVSDTGTGMAPEVVRRAFDPFFTTKPIGMGTGLGLSMIYGFVQQSGGQARIYSELGQGTMVCLYLPRHHGEAEAADGPGEPAAAQRAVAGETVLVVDDEPTVRMLVAEVLEDLGYTAIEAADGAAGLQVLQSDVRIDLLVTDVGLPGGMNGRQVADAARVSRPNLKVLFITGYAENAVLSHGHLEPGMHILTKPFAMEALASRIKELIAGP